VHAETLDRRRKLLTLRVHSGQEIPRVGIARIDLRDVFKRPQSPYQCRSSSCKTVPGCTRHGIFRILPHHLFQDRLGSSTRWRLSRATPDYPRSRQFRSCPLAASNDFSALLEQLLVHVSEPICSAVPPRSLGCAISIRGTIRRSGKPGHGFATTTAATQ